MAESANLTIAWEYAIEDVTEEPVRCIAAVRSSSPSASVAEAQPRRYQTTQVSWRNQMDDKAGLRQDAVGSQVVDVREAQEMKETGDEEGYQKFFRAEAADLC